MGFDQDRHDERLGRSLSERLSAVADAQAGPALPAGVPLAELRAAGRRRVRRRRGLQTAAVVLAVAGSLSLGLQLRSAGTPRPVSGASPVASPSSPSPAASSGAPSAPAPPADPFACPGSSPASESPTDPGPSGPANDPVVQTAAGTVSALGPRDYPEQFAGVCVDSAEHTLYVYRVPGSDFDTAARQQAQRPGLTLRFVDAKYSAAQLKPIAARIRADLPWRSLDGTITSVSTMADGSGIRVGSARANAVRAELLAAYGPAVTVVQEEAPQAD
ncbi:hypothetical protein OHV05_31180 [Kitasatospora sp. NBC_00070]|uniref:hypothetical protein n=1 Tax=Kitasatospora sp. NBC_00070 TaxID=2975962 RepID=UPI00324B37CA